MTPKQGFKRQAKIKVWLASISLIRSLIASSKKRRIAFKSCQIPEISLSDANVEVKQKFVKHNSF